MKKLSPFLLSLISALLLSLSWQKYATVFIFIAFVPLLFIADEYSWTNETKRKGLKKFGLYYFTFLVWNLLTTWWVYNASPAAIMAWTLNSLFMVWTLRLAWWVKKRYKSNWSYFILIPFWLSFEYLHQQWDLSWTWLTLGNVFANQSELVQWYELTGTSGGSAWILSVNILIFLLIKSKIATAIWNKKLSLMIALLLLVPSVISFVLYFSLASRLQPTLLPQQSIVVVQPNIDPYNEKFSSDPREQIQKTLDLISDQKDSVALSHVDYLVFPETFLIDNIWENELPNVYQMDYFREFLLKKYPKLTIITGATTLKQYGPKDKISSTAHKFTQEDGYYDFYNAALQIDTSYNVQIYRKSKLVPGSEIMPFLWLIKPLEKYALDLGGTVGSLGLQQDRSVFANKSSGIRIAPIICYESVYPEYVSEYVKNGANMLFIITNDGWWGDTPGYHQHLAYGALRAIETRKPIARSANTGTSCFVNEKGQAYEATKWWEPAVIQATLHPNTYQTIFVRVGDVCAKISLFITLILFLFSLFKQAVKQ